MPFTPSIIEEDIDNYIINDKEMFCPYMVLTFNTTKLAQQILGKMILFSQNALLENDKFLSFRQVLAIGELKTAEQLLIEEEPEKLSKCFLA